MKKKITEYYYRIKANTETAMKIEWLHGDRASYNRKATELLIKAGAEGYYPDPDSIGGGIKAFCFPKDVNGFEIAPDGKGYIPTSDNTEIYNDWINLPKVMPEALNKIIGTKPLSKRMRGGCKVYRHPDITAHNIIRWYKPIKNKDIVPSNKEYFECDKRWNKLTEKWSKKCTLLFVESHNTEYDKDDLEHIKSIECAFRFYDEDYSLIYDGESILFIEGDDGLFDSFSSFIDGNEEKLEQIFKQYCLYYELCNIIN